MFNFLLADETANSASTSGSWWIYVVLIVLVVAMLVLPSITNRRRMKEYNQMLDQLRVGDEVRTIGGIIGRVTKINNKNNIKTFILETGAKGAKTTMEFDIASVGTVLKSTYVSEENKAEKNKEVKVEEPAAEEAVPADETAEATTAEATTTNETTAEVEANEVASEKKPVAKKTTKKKK